MLSFKRYEQTNQENHNGSSVRHSCRVQRRSCRKDKQIQGSDTSQPSDTLKIRGVNQTLDLWTGKIDSKFEHEGVKYIPKKWERNILTPLEKDALKLVDWRCRAYMIPLLLPLIIRRGTMKKLP